MKTTLNKRTSSLNRTRLIGLMLLAYGLLLSLSSKSQTTITHDIPWHSDTIGVWGSGSTAWSINQVDTLAELTLGPYSDNYSLVYQIPFPISDSVGVIFDYGAYLDMRLIFEMSGWDGGASKINYPTKIEMDFPTNGTFSNGEWVSIPSQYRELDPNVHPGDADQWEIYADWPDAGKIELFINIDLEAHADVIYSDPTDPLNIIWDTLHVFDPIDIHLDTFDIFLADLVNNEYVIPWVDYHTDAITGATVVDSVYFLHDSIGWPLSFPTIFYDLIGISGDISIPNIDTYTHWINNEQRLYAWGQDEYLHINLDIVKFIQMTTHYLAYIPSMQALESVSQALDYEEGDTSIYVFTDPVSGEDFTAELSWDLLDAELLFTNSMNQTLMFEDVTEYTFFGMPIGPDTYPNVWNVFDFPFPVEYQVLDTLGVGIESGTAQSIKFGSDYDLMLRLPCYEADTLPVSISHTIDPWFTNLVRDSIDVDLYLKVLDISYSLGTPSNPIISEHFVLYEDTLTLGSFAGPPLFGPPIFMPWLIDGYFVDTTFVPAYDMIPTFTPLADSLNAQDVVCFGTPTGQLQVWGLGGSPPYTYQWADQSGIIISTNSVVNNVGIGEYFVTVTDQNTCQVFDSISVVSLYSEIQISEGLTHIECFGEAQGSIQLGITGGTPNYQFAWTPLLGNTAFPTGLISGNYIVTVTDQNACTQTDTFTLVDLYPEIVIQTIHVNDAICYGTPTGSIDVDVTGGLAPYYYTWSNGQHVQDPDSILGGTHTLTVTDSNACTQTHTVTVGQPAQIPIVAQATPTHICPESSSVLTVTGAVSYVWSPATSLSSGLGASVTAFPDTTTTYTIVGTDAAGCTESTQVTLNVYSSPVVLVGGTHHLCSGDSTILSATGAVSYVWNSGQTSQTVVVSPNPSYTFQVIGADAHGCKDTATHYVEVTQTPVANAGIDDSVCVLNYQLHAIPSVGYAQWYNISGYGLTFSPSANDPNAQITASYTGLYTLVWIENNSNGCVDSDTVQVLMTQIPTSSFTISDVLCYGDLATVHYTGTGHSACQYNWDWNNANVISGSGMGPYQVNWNVAGDQTIGLTVSLNNCTSIGTYESTYHPSDLMSNVVQTSVRCHGESNGALTANAIGGSAPYHYAWSIGSFDSHIDGLVAGDYILTTSDSHSCRQIDTIHVSEPEIFDLQIPQNFTVCPNQIANIELIGTGGTPPYQYFWNNVPSGSGQDIQIDTTHTYYASAVDLNGCLSPIRTLVVTIPEPVVLTATSDKDTTCLGETIRVQLHITEGIEPYLVTNQNHQMVNDWYENIVLNQSTQLEYFVVDACQQKDTASISIGVFASPNIDFVADYTSGCEPFEVHFAVQSHTPQSYEWHFGDETMGLSNGSTEHTYRQAGIFDVEVRTTDAHGCVYQQMLSQPISVYPKPQADFTHMPNEVNYIDGTVHFVNQSDNQLSSYWTFGDGASSWEFNPDHQYKQIGQYIIRLKVTSAYGCTDSTDRWIRVTDAFRFYSADAFTPGGDAINDYFFPQMLGVDASRAFNFRIYDRWGMKIYESTEIPIGSSIPGNEYHEVGIKAEKHGWNGRFANTGEFVKLGVYIWIVRLTDTEGVVREYEGTVNVIF